MIIAILRLLHQEHKQLFQVREAPPLATPYIFQRCPPDRLAGRTRRPEPHQVGERGCLIFVHGTGYLLSVLLCRQNTPLPSTGYHATIMTIASFCQFFLIALESRAACCGCTEPKERPWRTCR